METKEKILVVDDEKNMCKILRDYLEEDGYEVIEVYSGRDALDITKKENLCLVIIDVALSGIDGYMLARALRGDEKTFLVPIIMISAKKKEYKDKLVGFISGACDYLVKPFTREELLNSVHRALPLQ